MAYSDKVLDHYSNPRNVGSMDKNSQEVGTGLVGAPECGDEVFVQREPVGTQRRKADFAPAISEPMSSESTRLSFRPSGTSAATNP